MNLHLRHIHHGYAQQKVLQNLSLELPSGHIACLLGHSGCGKTTVLRLIAGFEQPAQGKILLGDRCLTDPHKKIPPHQRGIGMVFQDYALFPHLNVVDNIGFSLQRANKYERRKRVNELLELVGLTLLGERFPYELSGGQQQRVALARALACRPALILLDEPFSNLDVSLRMHLSREIRDILKYENMTALMVTHDQNEAFAMADDLGVLIGGGMAQWGQPYDLYHHPHSRAVAEFIGESSFIGGRVISQHTVACGLGLIQGHLPECFKVGDSVEIMLRPEDFIPDPQSEQKFCLEKKYFRGANYQYILRLPNSQESIQALVPMNCHHQVGEQVGFTLKRHHFTLFHEDHVHRLPMEDFSL
jgi:iron(III) transport system ATP-binding protein